MERERRVQREEPFFALPEVPDVDLMMSGTGRRKDPWKARRLPSGEVLCRLWRDADFGGPSLVVRSETGEAQPDGSVLVRLDGFWSHHLTAIQPGTMGFGRVELIARPDVTHLRPRSVRLPMATTPPGWNDRTGALRFRG